MTVSTLHVRTDAYAGDGVSTVFPVTFQFLVSADLRVIEVSADGVETPKSLGAHYTVSGGNGGTGNVTALSAPPAGVFWVIVRQTGRDQPISWAEGGPLTAASLQKAVDKNALLVQEADNRAARGVRLPDSDPDGLTMTLPAAAARAGRAVVFGGDGGVDVSNDTYNDQLANVTAQAALAQAWAVGGGGVPAGQSAAAHAQAAAAAKDDAEDCAETAVSARDEAVSARDLALAVAAGLNLPLIGGADAGLALIVNSEGDGYALGAASSNVARSHALAVSF